MQVHFELLNLVSLALVQSALWSGLIWIIALLAIVGLAWLFFRYYFLIRPELPAKSDDPFCGRHITQTFISSIPILTRELNLEVATAKHLETIERADPMVWLGMINLGTNKAQIRVPVTYRYHLQLRDPWHLTTAGQTVIVCAPMIRAALPPAIHTSEMEQLAERGWGRISFGELLTQLQKDLTETLSQYANDPLRIAQVRENCRQSVTEFVRLWLHREGQSERFTQIQVQFTDESALPAAPTTRFLNDP